MQRAVGVDPAVLWHEIRRAVITKNDAFVRYRGRCRGGRHLYSFQTPAGVFAAIVDQTTHDPITVMLPGMKIKRRKPSARKGLRNRVRA